MHKIKTKLQSLKQYISKNKKKVAVLLLTSLIILIVVGIFIINTSKLSLSNDSGKITTLTNNELPIYDFVFNPSSGVLALTNDEGSKYKEILVTDEIILDYDISPNKKSIVYTAAPKDYKTRIFASNFDVSKFNNIPAVAFALREFNIETGEKRTLWFVDTIEIKPTTQKLYNTKQIVHPDSYVVYGNYEMVYKQPTNIDPTVYSYPLSYENENNGEYAYEYVLHSYPISYIEYVDDLEGGYLFSDYLPWDSSTDLTAKSLQLIGYDETSNKIAVFKENTVTIFGGTEQKKYVIPDSNNCNIYNINSSFDAYYSNNYLGLENISCINENTYQKYYKVTENDLEDIVPELHVDFGNFTLVETTPDYLMLASYPRYGYFYEKDLQPMSLVLRDNSTGLWNKVAEDKIMPKTSIMKIDSDIECVLLKNPIDSTEYTEYLYSINGFDFLSKELTEIATLTLPKDILNPHFDSKTREFSYARRYSSSSESIIEFRTVNVDTKEERELKTFKIRNDSVMFYNPKILWL